MRLAVAALALLAAVLPALAEPTMPEGIYACTLDGGSLGEIRLGATTYQGLAEGGAFGDEQRFITMDPDRIEWLGDMGKLSADGYRVDKTVITNVDGKAGFDLTLLTPDQSTFVTASCVLG